MAKPLFLFNGKALPGNPSKGYLEENEQLVKGTRNMLGQTVSQKINRRICKFSSLSFPFLSLQDYNWLKRNVENFEVDLTYYDTLELKVITRKFYFGNLTGTPCEWDNESEIVQKPIKFKDVKVNIVDMGY